MPGWGEYQLVRELCWYFGALGCALIVSIASLICSTHPLHAVPLAFSSFPLTASPIHSTTTGTTLGGQPDGHGGPQYFAPRRDREHRLCDGGAHFFKKGAGLYIGRMHACDYSVCTCHLLACSVVSSSYAPSILLLRLLLLLVNAYCDVVFCIALSARVHTHTQVTDKTRGDVQGGTLIQYEGKAKLLEIAQVS